jgi:anti-sigma factor RsiW
MTSNYDDFSDYVTPTSDLEAGELDYFELLSVYIDGEATVEERKQVQQWLDNDPEIKKIYLQLLRLQGGMQSSTIPPQERTSAEVLAEQVFNRIDRTHNRKKAVIWGSAIAATIVATVTSIVPNSLSPSFRMAENSPQNNSSPLMVAVSLNKPTVIIPKAAVATPNIQEVQERI